jgi:hypothetical protein
MFVQVSAPREITILMSAVRLEPREHPSDSSKLVHEFVQKVPIPTYLIAIVGGALKSKYVCGDKVFLYAHLKTGRIMLWRCPSVHACVSPSVVISVFRTFFCCLCSYCIETWFIAL